MIIFGTRQRHIDGPEYDGMTCPRCHTATRLATSGTQRWFHLYWIPVLPTSHATTAQCSECGHTVDERELPAHLVNRVAPVIFTRPRRLSRWIGSGVIVILALWLYAAL